MQRLWSKVNKTDTCWEWTACKSRGYGQINIDGKLKLAHRVVYELLVSEIPKDKVIDHLCRNKACVNPKHLEVVTQRENTLRGIGPTARLAKRTHCKNGHEYTAENTTMSSIHGRRCMQCNRDIAKRYYWTHKLSAT